MKITPNQIILFDLDHTVHSPHKFRELYKAKLLSNLSIKDEEFEKARLDYDATLKKRTFFHPHKYTAHLAKHLGHKHSELKKHYYHDLNFEKSIFEETKEVLEPLSKTHKLGVYSEGYKSAQIRKIKKGKVQQFFDPALLFIFFNKRTKRVLDLLPKNAVIVDDNPDVINILLQRADLIPVWINRKDKSKHHKAYTIHSLKELLGLIA